VTELTDKFNALIPFNGTQTFYMQYDAGVQADSDWELTLVNVNPFSVYLSAGLAVDPTESTNDIEVKGQTYVKLSSRSFPSLKASFVIQAHVEGISYPENKVLQNNLMVTFNRVPTMNTNQGFLYTE